MRRPQSEDDGSVLKYVTEDELKRASQITRYTSLSALYKFEETLTTQSFHESF